MSFFSDFAVNFDEIGTVLTVWGKQSYTATTTAVKAAVLAGNHTAVEATPVDKGDARSNWVVTIDEIFEGQIPAYAPGSKLGRGEAANLIGATAQGETAVATFDSQVNNEVHIQNNLDYIELLDAGYSAQQPASMLALALQSAQAAAEAAFGGTAF